eukprot:459190_1
MDDEKIKEKKEEKDNSDNTIPNDVYKDVMSKFLIDAEIGCNKLINIFGETIKNCNKLAISLGEKLTDKYTLCDFWETVYNIKVFWNEADNSLCKIEQNKAKAKAKAQAKAKKKAAKSKVKDTLKRRASKDVLKQKGIYKSAKDIKKEKQKKREIGQMALQNLIDKQIKEERKLINNINNQQQNGNLRMTRHKSLYLAQTRYKCSHCNVIIQDVANLSGDNSHCHQCYATPHDKQINNLSLQWLSLGVKNHKCLFKCIDPCLIIYTEKKNIGAKKDGNNGNNLLLIKSKNFKTTDDLKNSSLSNLRDINYDDMLYGTGLINDGTSELTNSLDLKPEKRVLHK